MKICFRELLCGIIVFLLSAPAFSSGFAIDEQDAQGLGTALAGKSALANTPSTIFYNPAGMARLEGNQASASTILVLPNGSFENQGSSLSGATLTGGDGGNPGVFAALPATYLALKASDVLYFGIGVNSPFGLSSTYEEDWVGRYHAVNSALLTLNINPAVALRLSDKISVGVGLNAQYLDVKLISAVDMGTLLASPQLIDGRSNLTGTSWAYGFNAGLLVEVSPELRFGAAFRSKIHHLISGRADFEVPVAAAALTAGGLFLDTDAQAELTFPETISLSAYYDVTPRLAVLADFTVTKWSRYQELRVTFENSSQPDQTERQGWRDAVRVSLGAIYRASRHWTFRAGTAFDATPIPNEFQNPRLVVGNRILVGFGAAYRYSDDLTFELAYMHSFSENVSVDMSAPAASGRLLGEFHLSADLLTLRANFRF